MLTVALASIVLVLIITVVGGGLAWLTGLRGPWLWAAAAPFAFSVVAIASVLAPFVGIDWSIVPVIAVAAVLGAGIVVARRVFVRGDVPAADSSWRRSELFWAVIALVIAAALLGWRTVSAFDGPEAISQTFDNIFHLNAIRFILETGSASSLDVGKLTGAMSFYPALWHATCALLVQLTGATIPAAVQAATLVISAVVWPVGAIALSAALFGPARAIVLSAGIVAASLPAFPILMLEYGVLYPYQLSLALLPGTLAITVALFRVRRPDSPATGWWVFAFAGCLPGLVLAHPGGFVGWIVFSAPMVLLVFIRLWRSAETKRRRVMTVVGLVGYLGVVAVLVRILRPPAEARGWHTPLSLLEAIWQTLSVSMFVGVSAVVAAVALLIGIVLVVRERSVSLWVAGGMWLVGAVLFIVVAGVPQGAIRDAFTGSWYNDWPRLTALFGVVVVPLAAYGLAWSAQRIATLIRLPKSTWLAGSVTLVVAVGVAVLAQFPAMPVAERHAHHNYVMNADSRLLTPDERSLLQRIPEHVPVDGVIAGNPYTGTSLAYAYSGRRVLMPHALMYLTAEGHAINEGLDEANFDIPVCDALRTLGVTYVLDFGGREVHDEKHRYTGLDDLETSDAVRLVDEQGDARLYEIVACGLG